MIRETAASTKQAKPSHREYTPGRQDSVSTRTASRIAVRLFVSHE